MARILKLKALSEALGIDKGQLSRETKRVGFPMDVVNGDKLFNADEVRAWRAANIRQRKASTKAPNRTGKAVATKPASEVEVSSRELTADEEKFISILEDPAASTVAKADASYHLVCVSIARSYRAGVTDVRQLDTLKKHSEELRRAKVDYIEISEREGELVPREVGLAVLGEMAQRLIDLSNNLASALGVQLEQWLTDTEFGLLSADERSRIAREWCEKHAKDLRRMEADRIEKMLERELSE